MDGSGGAVSFGLATLRELDRGTEGFSLFLSGNVDSTMGLEMDCFFDCMKFFVSVMRLVESEGSWLVEEGSIRLGSARDAPERVITNTFRMSKGLDVELLMFSELFHREEDL